MWSCRLGSGGDTIFSFHIILEGIPISWILLEFQRNLNIFSNLFLLINIIEGDRCMNVHKNLGMFRANLVGFIPGCLENIWYDPKGISNILGLSQISDNYKYWVQYDSQDSKDFIITCIKDVKETRFCRESLGLQWIGIIPSKMLRMDRSSSIL